MFTCSMSRWEWDFGLENEPGPSVPAVHVISRKEFRPGRISGRQDVAAGLVNSWTQVSAFSDTVPPSTFVPAGFPVQEQDVLQPG